MIRKAFLILVFTIFFLFHLSLYAGQAKVYRVIDGDTVQALAGASKITIRLVGIDAPELGRGKRDPGQPFCRQSQKTLAALVLNQVVEIKSYGLDQYDRTLAEIFCKNKNINLEMIRSGMAEVYRGRQPKGLDIQSYRDLEQQAQAVKIGIWSLGSEYQSPKEWRKEKRAQ
ncbi:MAG: nuclease [Desulfobacteraceae bacterium]|nr:MAG: nuclease [Desulfobacteraceae bacterium]